METIDVAYDFGDFTDSPNHTWSKCALVAAEWFADKLSAVGQQAFKTARASSFI